MALRALTETEKKHYFEVYQAGEKAHRLGQSREDCPYEVTTWNHATWMAGFGDAMALAREAVI
ncbi:Rmf/CrpP family protein [Vibrio alginolyticus]